MATQVGPRPVNLIQNGTFSDGVEGWEPFHDGWLTSRPWKVWAVDDPDISTSPVLEWQSYNGTADGNTTGVDQMLQVRIADFQSLVLELDLKIISHSLRGGGWGLGGEYPVEICLIEVDPEGNSYGWNTFHKAFYSWGPPPEQQQPVWDPELIPRGEWYHFRSPNLVQTEPADATITMIRLSGSGWDYHARVDNVALWGIPAVVAVEVDIDPDTLGLRCRGRWITAYIYPPEGYSLRDILPGTVVLHVEGADGKLPAAWTRFRQDYLMAKFDRQWVQRRVSPPEGVLVVNGQLSDGRTFEGRDTIKVVDPKRSRHPQRR